MRDRNPYSILAAPSGTTPAAASANPNHLCGNGSGYWSRRIDREHRRVDAIKEDAILIAQCRFHYQPRISGGFRGSADNLSRTCGGGASRPSNPETQA
ncbi:MAG: type II toxin-antitoxin system YoeB family toxin [Gammaproteobacteria bacterium]|nr:type II toxin-antitoxin system YoeB family toxin [Gammaproteobacteria bacterium]